MLIRYKRIIIETNTVKENIRETNDYLPVNEWNPINASFIFTNLLYNTVDIDDTSLVFHT